VLTHDRKLDDAAHLIALTPEETALSIVSEVVAVRNGREGGRFPAAEGRVHEVGA
jgi:xanthine dehydrogenase accessory factor